MQGSARTPEIKESERSVVVRGRGEASFNCMMVRLGAVDLTLIVGFSCRAVIELSRYTDIDRLKWSGKATLGEMEDCQYPWK